MPVDCGVVPLEVPVVVDPQDWLVLLQAGRELDKLVQRRRNLKGIITGGIGILQKL